MKNNKRKVYKKINNFHLNIIDSYFSDDLFDFIYNIYLNKFLKYIFLICTTYFLLYVNISNIYIFIKKNSLLKQLRKFENKKNDDTESEILNFYDINSKNILLESNTKINDFDTNIPYISVILLIYNQANIIHTSLRSIQNQSLKNIEIIIIDDCSYDDSISIIKKYLEEDKRIKLIEHRSNEGKIKSRSEGISLSKGKYITVVDGDDALIHQNILYNSFYIASLANLDIVEFKIAKYKAKIFLGILTNYKYINNIEQNIIYQPELRIKFIIRNESPSVRGILNRNICGKLIKSSIFKKALSIIGTKYTEDYILVYEDTIMAISLLQIANSYYLMKEKGYYYNKDEERNKIYKFTLKKNRKCKIKKNVIKGLDQVKYLNFLLEHTKDNYIERQLIYYEIKSMSYWEGFHQTIENHFEMIYKIFDKILKIRFLTRKQIAKIIYINKQILRKEKNMSSYNSGNTSLKGHIFKI